MLETKHHQHRTGFFWLDFIVAVSAIAISLISLWVAQRSDGTQERLLAASVWPYVEFYTSNVRPDFTREIKLVLQNSGVGPARIRWMTLTYHGKTMRTYRDLLKACCDKKGVLELGNAVITSSITGRVLEPHEPAAFVTVDRTAANAAAYAALDKSLSDMRILACYCSVLDDCWMLKNHTADDPKPVNTCMPMPADVYST